MKRMVMMGLLALAGVVGAGTASAGSVGSSAVYSIQPNGDTLAFANASTESSWQAIRLSQSSLGTGSSGEATGQLSVTAQVPGNNPAGLSVALSSAQTMGGELWVYLDIERSDTTQWVNTDVWVTVTDTATGQSVTQTIHVNGAATN